MMRKTFLYASPFVMGAVAIGVAKESAENQEKSLICRPSELPVYNKYDTEPKRAVHKKSKVAESIEGVSKSVREELTKYTDFYESQRSKVEVHYVNFMKDTQHIRNYLQEEDNTLPRAGAIALSAFSGVILGIRGGFFRKLFYGTLTGSGMAAICYPREAKKYATVAFNFAYGKRPNDENQKDLPKFPSSFGEVKDHVVGLYDSVFKK